MSVLNVAVIGSNGFIGSHLTNYLLTQKNIHLTLFGRSSRSSSNSNILYHQINLMDSASNANYFKDIDLIYYLVSETIPANSWANPLIDVEKNLIPFLTFTECISKLKVKKIVYLSSAGTVYGTTNQKVNEEFDKNPFSPYGITKLTIENFLRYYKTKYNINYDVYRISNVYGSGQDTSKGLGLINTLLEKIITENKITVFGDGNNLRNYVYVNDVAKLLTLSIDKPINNSEVYNLSSNDTLTINEIVEMIKKAVTEKFSIQYTEKRDSDNAAIDLDNTKLRNAMKDFKFTPIQQGILETYQHLKNHSK
ncbi:MAG: NAD-dependent epimerase/dehydratase family protein [Bacteroidetes bacterium]|nr:NAD-dependent epimerase/dehydratase family protein [Bacteroidota bacterium]MCA6443781.1 NAD-dependent epimerase/dehydratase family protein [Bacteroidota bacterium]